MRKKSTAGLFALLMGTVGLHWFYLGKRIRGVVYFFASAFAFLLSVQNDAPIILIPMLVALIDTLLLFSMPMEEFDEKYNQQFLGKKKQVEEPFRLKKMPTTNVQTAAVAPVNKHKASGIEKFKDYDYDDAIEDFKLALADKYDDPAVHFNLACCYSLLEKPGPAFFHLGKAVQFGFVDFDKIDKHDGLAFLRTQADFREFVKQGYQHRPALPSQEENLLAQKPKEAEKNGEDNLLEQIKRLSELRNQGILTQEEFLMQTKQVLGR